MTLERRLSRLALPAPVERQRFRRRLLTWYWKHGRDLPWRRTRDPYRILVSEIMLQQTQVDRVMPKYKEWLKKTTTSIDWSLLPQYEKEDMTENTKELACVAGACEIL